MGENEAITFLSAFGPLKSFHLVRDPGAPTNKGYAFCEYQSPEAGQQACSALNGKVLGSRILSLRRGAPTRPPTPPPQPSPSSLSQDLVNSLALRLQLGPCGSSTPTNPAPPPHFNTYASMPAPPPITLPYPSRLPPPPSQSFPFPTNTQPTPAGRVNPAGNIITSPILTFLCPINIATGGEQVVAHECAKYGQVKQVTIPQPGEGRVFVEFNSVYEAQKAGPLLATKGINGAPLDVTSFDQGRFRSGDLTI